MKASLYLTCVLLLLFRSVGTCSTMSATRWEAPFDTVSTVPAKDTLLTLRRALVLTASGNPVLPALAAQREAAQSRLRQAGLWPNPELESEIEEIGGDAPGLRELEMTVSLTQELELFGQRRARERAAHTNIAATDLNARFSAFDLYLDVKRRFHVLAHAQMKLRLAELSVTLHQDITDDIDFRISEGAALPSELLLARLELQRAEMAIYEARQELESARLSLVSLWGGDPTGITVDYSAEPDFSQVLDRLAEFDQLVDSSRLIVEIGRDVELVRAERRLAVAEAKPGITLSGGYRRLRADGFDSFLFGVSMPLPLFNRNQGTSAALDAQLRSLEYERRRASHEVAASIRAGRARLRQLIQQHDILDADLLPTAEAAYEMLRRTYDAGRVAYASLLEASRSLVDLRFEHNDILLIIHEQIVELENITGIALQLDQSEEN